MMSKNFPHLSNNSEFPLLGNVDVYKYDNDFDYSRYDYTQMELQVCTVPWDMGEVHIGNRTLSGVGNVVYFESKKKRDEWFDAIPDSECYRFETKFRELHREHVIDVPIPFDMCARHNYLVVRYSILANENSPIQYEGKDGAREWFWFIREVEFISPNTTRLHLLEDAFQTWIYDVDVTGMILERGHAPMFAVDVDDYLDNPLDNNSYLLTEDVSFGQVSQVKHIDALSLNAGNMYACIATTADPSGSWGTKSGNTWNVPASASYTNNGVPSVRVFAVKASDLNTLLTNVTSSYPQFKQTVQGVFFASDNLLTLGAAFTFASVECRNVSASRKTFDLTSLNRSLFGYADEYSEIAKLYTSPYAHIEITDENSNIDIVRIEDTTGKIQVSAALSLAYPFVTIDAHLLGVGGSANAKVAYKNVDSHTFNVSGQWYETLRSWNVPTFAVVLDSASEYDYSTHFDRAQRKVDYDANYDNAIASASTAKSNADASADVGAANTATLAAAAKANADASAGTVTANAALTTTCNDAVTARSNQSATEQLGYAQTYNSGVASFDNIMINYNASSTISANNQQAAVSTAAAAVTGTAGAIGAAASGDIGGGISASLNAIVGAGTTIANTAIANGLTQTQAGYQCDSNDGHATASNTKSQWDVTAQTNAATDIKDANNTMITGSASNSASTMSANAGRTQTAENTAATNTQTTEKANATRTYNATSANATRSKSAAQSAIANDTKQAALRSPFLYGSFANGDSATTKPMALFANVVTQSKGAIESAGDEMLRYGYTLDRAWKFDGNWNIGKYFTYWKLRDFWVSNLNVPDMYMDRLRFFLYGGVTVWRNPEDIGNVTIYENM